MVTFFSVPLRTPDSEYEDLPFPSLDGATHIPGGGQTTTIFPHVSSSHFHRWFSKSPFAGLQPSPAAGGGLSPTASAAAAAARPAKTFYEVVYRDEWQSLKSAPRKGT